jgi:hypothetical protein
MSTAGSVTLWLQQLQGGDPAPLQMLWEGYFRRLVALARKKLQGAPRQVADEEDAALLAFDSFIHGVEQGRFPRLADRGDLWDVLELLTVRKAANLARNAYAQKRYPSNRQLHNASALDGAAFTALISREPDPALAAELAEEYRRLLAQLPNESLRTVARLKMEGHSNEEIAGKIGRSTKRVEGKLADIRKIWEKRAKA